MSRSQIDWLIISSGLLGVLVLSIVIGATKPKLPTHVHCTFTEQIFIESTEMGNQPLGSVSGCRCKILYKDRIYIDFENRDKKECR
jgi:hypothetical protein